MTRRYFDMPVRPEPRHATPRAPGGGNLSVIDGNRLPGLPVSLRRLAKYLIVGRNYGYVTFVELQRSR